MIASINIEELSATDRHWLTAMNTMGALINRARFLCHAHQYGWLATGLLFLATSGLIGFGFVTQTRWIQGLTFFNIFVVVFNRGFFNWNAHIKYAKAANDFKKFQTTINIDKEAAVGELANDAQWGARSDTEKELREDGAKRPFLRLLIDAEHNLNGELLKISKETGDRLQAAMSKAATHASAPGGEASA